jgi:aspartokinase-like uncharacterized kinase
MQYHDSNATKISENLTMRRIIKIGGSMLLRDNLATAVNQWLDTHPSDQTMIIIGGGKLIDAVRELDQRHKMPPQQMHWMCVDLLAATASFAADFFGWPLIKTKQEWKDTVQPGTGFPNSQVSALPTVVTPAVFYNRNTSVRGTRSPHDWRTTTDSIAAFLAHQVDADELVLLKSCPIAPKMSLEKLAEAGIVDEAFPEVARDLRSIRIEQLG